MSVTMKKTATMQTVSIPTKKSLLMDSSRTTSSLSSGRRAPNLRRDCDCLQVRHLKNLSCIDENPFFFALMEETWAWW